MLRQTAVRYLLITATFAAVDLTAGSRSIHLDCSEHGSNLEARLDKYSSPDLLVLERCTLEDIGFWLSYVSRRSIPVYTLWLRTIKSSSRATPLTALPREYCLPSAYGPKVIKITDTLTPLDHIVASITACTAAHSLELAGNHLNGGEVSFVGGGEAVQRINMSQCGVKELNAGVFEELRKLTDLDLSKNKLVKLPASLFRTNRKLENLYLQQNSISFITRQSFAGLRHLRHLDLSQNDLASVWLSDHVFGHLGHLRHLNLSNNRITELDATLFNALHGLTTLDLTNNAITRIEEEAFYNQTELETLLLSSNALTGIAHGSLRGLASLKVLDLSSNKISFIHEQAFESLSRLEVLDLRNNDLNLIPVSLKYLPNLSILNLSSNVISELSGDNFLLESLKVLILSDNQIMRIRDNYFNYTLNLEELNLAKNRLNSISPDLFNKLDKLRDLNLAHNELTDINGLFTTHSTLLSLNVSYNKEFYVTQIRKYILLKWFDMAFIPRSLEVLAVQGNQVEELGNYYNLVDGFHLKTLDISNNRIAELNENSFVESLEYVNLRGNNISDLGSGSFSGLRHLRRVDLRNNALQTVPRTSIKTSPMSEGKPEFLVSNNPLVCDCELEWLSSYTPGSPNSPGLISDHASLMCTMPLAGGSGVIAPAPVPVKSVPSDQFLCQYSSHCFSLCRCCTFLACDCRMKCPDPCQCFHDQAWNLNMIKCGGRNLTHVLREIPMDSTILYLDANHLKNLGTEKFLGRNRLATLYLNSSEVYEISNRTFLGLWGLKELHLEYNAIETVPSDSFMECSELEELYLHNNVIRFIDNATFADMAKLRILTLHNNQLSSLSLNLAQTTSMRSLTLGRNPWTCSCELSLFFQRVSDSTGQQRVAHIMCTDGLASHSIVSFYSSCRDLDVLAVASKTSSSTLLLLLISVSVGLISLIAISVFLVIKRKSLTRWIYSNSRSSNSKVDDPSQYSPMLKLPSPEPLKPVLAASQSSYGAAVPSMKEYSAYLHYCLADDNYARNVLAARLENTGGQQQVSGTRLCLHHRDLPKTCTVGQAISQAVANSSCLLIVASPAYFMSSIPSYELQMILSEVLPRYSYINTNSSASAVASGALSYPVIVAVSGTTVRDIKSKFGQLAGCQADTWIYLDVTDSLFFDKLSALIHQGAAGGNLPPSAHDTSSESSSCSTKSTSASTLPARRVSTPRVITNPLERFTPTNSAATPSSSRTPTHVTTPMSGDSGITSRLLLPPTSSTMSHMMMSGNGGYMNSGLGSHMDRLLLATTLPNHHLGHHNNPAESIYQTVHDPASDNEDPMYQTVYATDPPMNVYAAANDPQTVYIDRNLDLVQAKPQPQPPSSVTALNSVMSRFRTLQ